MTGLYNHRNYIRFGLLDPEATTFGRILKNAGYVTGIFGKWQLEGGLAGSHSVRIRRALPLAGQSPTEPIRESRS